MYSYRLVLSFLALFSLLLSSCEKDTEDLIPEGSTVISGLRVEANFKGRLTDPSGQPIANARVQAGNKNTTTDIEGLWVIRDAMVVEDQAYITFSSNDYLKGSRTLLVKPGGEYQVDVQLLPRQQSYQVNAASGGLVTIANSQASVRFPENAFVSVDGSPVSGNVTVVAHYLDPDRAATYAQMPGDLRAFDVDNQLSLLITYGMIAVELSDASGAEVKIAEGKTATISMPVPASQLSNAPSTIPLWYFDESKATWIEEGEATRQGNSYVGEVKHFTFWNCDIPTDFIKLCGSIELPNSQDTVNMAGGREVRVTSPTRGTRSAYTNQNGEFCGFVPINETLTLQLIGSCGQVVYETTIGPFSNDAILGTILLQPDSRLSSNVSGSVVCNGVPLAEGSVRISQDGSLLAVEQIQADGSFSIPVLACSDSELSIQVVNYAAGTSSEPITATFASTVELGQIDACEQLLEQYLILTIDGDVVFETTDFFYSEQSGQLNWIETGDSLQFQSFYLNFGQTGIPIVSGTYPLDAGPSPATLFFADGVRTQGSFYEFIGASITVSSAPSNPNNRRFVIGPVTLAPRGTQDTQEILIEFGFVY